MKKKIISLFLASGLVASIGAGGCAYKLVHDAVYDYIDNSESDFSIADIYGIEKVEEIDKEIDNIVKKLDLKKPTTPTEEYEMCKRVYDYIIYNNVINNSSKEYNFDNYIDYLYDGVIYHESNPLTNSLEMQYILDRVGIDAQCVISTDADYSIVNVSNLIKIDDKYYYFDSYYQQFLYLKFDKNIDTSLAGLGSESYEKIFIPVGVLSNNLECDYDRLPNNISKDDVIFLQKEKELKEKEELEEGKRIFQV